MTGHFASNERDLLLSTLQLKDRTGLTVRFWEKKRLTGDGPKFIAISSRCVRYRWGDVLDWLDARTLTSTSAKGCMGAQ